MYSAVVCTLECCSVYSAVVLTLGSTCKLVVCTSDGEGSIATGEWRVAARSLQEIGASRRQELAGDRWCSLVFQPMH